MSDLPSLIRPGLWAPRKHTEEIKKKLRAKVPKITLYDVRNERMSHHEALISDLFEKCYQLSAEFLRDLVQMERDFLALNKLPDPYLTIKAGKQCLLDAAQYLKRSEIKLKNFDKSEAVEELFQLAEYLATREYQLWIVEQIYLLAMEATEKFRLDGGLLEARVRYCYGRFLIEKCNLPDAAYHTLNIAHTMSVAKDWTIDLGTGIDKSLSKEVNYLLFICLSNQGRKCSPQISLDLSKRALKHALASENKYIIPRAYLERGDKEVEAKNYFDASIYYSKGIVFAQASNQPDYICEGYLKKGSCLHKMNVVSRATAFAKLAKKAAEDCQNAILLGKSYMLLGEISVTRSFMNIAAYNFRLAFDIFTELKNEKLVRDARFMESFAMAHLVLEPLISVILKSDLKQRPNTCMERLIRWKERQIPFWESPEIGCNMKSISDISETTIGSSLLNQFGIDENAMELDEESGEVEHHPTFHKHLFRQFREAFTMY